MLASLGVWQMVSFMTTCVLVDTLSSDVAGDPLSDDNHLLLIATDAAVVSKRPLKVIAPEQIIFLTSS